MKFLFKIYLSTYLGFAFGQVHQIQHFYDQALVYQIGQDIEVAENFDETRRRLVNFFESSNIDIDGLNSADIFNEFFFTEKFKEKTTVQNWFENGGAQNNSYSNSQNNAFLISQANRTLQDIVLKNEHAKNIFNNQILIRLTLDYLAFKLSSIKVLKEECHSIHNAYNSILLMTGFHQTNGLEDKKDYLVLTHINYLLSRNDSACYTNQIFYFGLNQFMPHMKKEVLRCDGMASDSNCTFKVKFTSKNVIFAESPVGVVEFYYSNQLRRRYFKMRGVSENSKSLILERASTYKNL